MCTVLGLHDCRFEIGTYLAAGIHRTFHDRIPAVDFDLTYADTVWEKNLEGVSTECLSTG